MKPLYYTIVFFSVLNVSAQIGGTNSYRFLDLPMTARAAALGGSNMSVWGDDINLIQSNPSLLNPSMVKQAALNYCNYVGDINYWYGAYAHNFGTVGTGAVSLQSFNYGKFTAYDEIGRELNSFNVNDHSLQLGFARPMADSTFNIGVALKTIASQYDTYSSYASAIDFGVTYHNKKDFSASILAKNVGYVWKTYTPNVAQTLPRTVQVGISKKIPNAPFRLMFVYDQLLKWNLRYINPEDTLNRVTTIGSAPTRDSSDFQRFTRKSGIRIDNFMRHMIIGAEIIVSKNFNLRIAYNYRRQREMILPERRTASWLSLGFGLRIKRFGFSYAFNKLAMPGNSSVIGLTFAW